MKKLSILFFVIIIASLQLGVNSQSPLENGNNIYSENVYMVNLDTGKVVYDLNSEKLVYPASLTKILTCIVAIEESGNLDEIVTIPSRENFSDVYADNGANIALKEGEEISLRDLIAATMIRSSCDTASAIAIHISGSVEAFAKLMNDKAYEIGAKNTHFVNAHGLHNPNHYTTAKDLSRIAEYALKNEEFCNIISNYTYTIPATNKSEQRTFNSTIEIEIPDNPLYYEYVLGIKSGYTDEAGRCLITRAKKNGESYLLVTLGANKGNIYASNMAFTDAVTLYEYHFAEFSIKTVADTKKVMGEVKVSNGEKETLELLSEMSVQALLPIDFDSSIEFNIPESVKAPIEKGDVIGSFSLTVDGEVFVKNLIASESVAKKPASGTFDSFNDGNKIATVLDFTSLFFLTATIIIAGVFLIKVFKKN